MIKEDWCATNPEVKMKKKQKPKTKSKDKDKWGRKEAICAEIWENAVGRGREDVVTSLGA